MNSKKWVQLLGIFFTVGTIFLFVIGYIFHNKYPNNALIHKEYLIKNYQPKIIFAGDSRSERQLNVLQTAKLLNLRKGEVINIATSSGDPLMINNLIDKYPPKFRNSILIVSISANQINDNAKKIKYFTYSMIAKMSYFEQLLTFVPTNATTLLKYYVYNVKAYSINKIFNSNKTSDSFVESFGFNGIEKKLDINTINIKKQIKNPWYENYSDGGIKYTLLSQSLKELKTKVKKLYVFTAPFAPKYINLIQDSKLLTYEKSFQNKIKNICIDNNITYKNYLVLDELNNEYFYDSAHLNLIGSKIFTKIILNDFGIKKDNYRVTDKNVNGYDAKLLNLSKDYKAPKDLP